MVQVSRLIALSAAVAVASTVMIQAGPIQFNPYTPINATVPLTASHPAYGGKVNVDCTEPVFPEDPNQAKAESMTITGSIYRKLRKMEDVSNTDVDDLEAYFGTSMELNFNTLEEQYGSAAAPSAPWASSYTWTVSASNGIDAHKNRDECSTDADYTRTNDGSKCGVRDGSATGYCIPTWWGLCHEWAPAAILEQEPECDVEKNGVTFHVFDIKALLTEVYAEGKLKTVFTGARYDGSDFPDDTDQYGRYTNAARRDLGARYFHIAISNIMGKQQQSFVVDVTAGAEVWNQPVRSYEVQTMELVDVSTASQQYFGTPTYSFNDEMVYLAYVKTTLSWISEAYEDGPLVSTGELDRFTSPNDYEYLLELDANYNVIGGEWVGISKQDHPDFLWFPTGKPNTSMITDAGLSYAELLELSRSCNSSSSLSTEAPTLTPTEVPTSTPTETPATLTPSSSSAGNEITHIETEKPTSVPSGSGSKGIYIIIATDDKKVGSGKTEGHSPEKPSPPSLTPVTTSPPNDESTPMPDTPSIDTPAPTPTEVTPAPEYPFTPSTPDQPNGKPTPVPASPVATTEPPVHFVC